MVWTYPKGSGDWGSWENTRWLCAKWEAKRLDSKIERIVR